MAIGEALDHERRGPRIARARRRLGSRLLHQLVEEQAARTPYDVAIQHGDRLTGYAELDGRANALAAALRDLGVGPDVPVVVALEPSTELVTTLLAVLKAGGCYVPVAPDTPPARVETLLGRVRPAVVVAEADGIAHAAREVGAAVVSPPAPGATPPRPRRPEGAAPAPVRPENLAYVIHTSGSTGEPRGVMVPHRGIVNTLRWRQRRFPFRPRDRVLLTFSFVFDASVFEIFQPLLAGARVVIPERPLGGDPAATAAAIRGLGITVLGIVPSLLEPLLDVPELAAATSLRVVFCGGERLTPTLHELFRRRCRAELVNVYGPTEASLEATAWTSRSAAPLSIGRPIDGVTAHVLDQRLRATDSGELFLAGAGLARGYWADPRTTAERFLPDPFATVPGSRMYRTGDLCRLLDGGHLDYAGRADDQVKLRGHRIELGDVEAALRAHAAVREAAVVLDATAPGGGALVAYVVPAGAPPTPAELRRHLGERLPAALLPGRTVVVDALPRTSGGKVDRRSLRLADPAAADGAVRAVSAAEVAPVSGGEVEALLRGLWRRVLGVPEVADDADFFELGGSSVQAAILAHALEERLGEFVYPIAVYDAPTVSRLAGYVRGNYAEAVTRLWGAAELAPAPAAGTSVVDADAVRRLQVAVRPVGPPPEPPAPGERLDPAVFVLSPPRSGSTLLRVVLGVHPGLFAPPELQLLNFPTLRARARALAPERDRFWLQGTVRALMELLDCDADEAERVMAECEARDLSVRDFYARLQHLAGDRVLVDKTPTYALDPATLRRAETLFREPRYLHLVREPGPATASFEEARLDVFFPAFLRADPGLSRRQLAESVWTLSHRNILEFLREVPAERRHTVRYEELVRDPETSLRRVTAFLGVPFDPAMTRPYQQDQRRLMTDPVRPLARMLGDVKFHQHGRIRADGRRPADRPAVLGEPTRRVAAQLGYRAVSSPRSLVTLQPAGRAPGLFLVHPAVGSVTCYLPLVGELGAGRPVHALRAGTEEEGPGTLEDLAAAYVEEVLATQPRGPFHLAGWSFGGLVAFEMARQLRSRGRRVGQLVLIGSHLPPVEETPFPSARDFMVTALREHLAASGRVPSRPVGDLRSAYREARAAGVIAPGQGYQEFREVMEGYERTYRGHVAMARAYRATPADLRVLTLDPADSSLDDRGRFPAWASVAAHVERQVLPGNHFTMLDAGHVAPVAELLRQRLRGADGRVHRAAPR